MKPAALRRSRSVGMAGTGTAVGITAMAAGITVMGAGIAPGTIATTGGVIGKRLNGA
jgi:hypothetical protein